MKYKTMLLALSALFAVSCGTQPASLLVGDLTGSLDVGVGGTVDPDINVIIDATVQADVECSIACDLNTGDCETVCELASGVPPTPEALGEVIYLAKCAGCHGNPTGTGFAPDLTGESAAHIVDKFNDPGHAGGPFNELAQVDIDNLAAYFASL